MPPRSPKTRLQLDLELGRPPGLPDVSTPIVETGGIVASRGSKIVLVGAAVAMALLLGVAAAPPARADDAAMAELLKILRDRGSISEAEYEALSGASTHSKDDAAGEPDTAAPGAAATEAVDAGAATEAAPSGDTKSLEQVAGQVDAQAERITRAEQEIESQKKSFLRIEEIADETSSDLFEKMLEGKWYERLSFGGYTQFRIGEVLHQNGPDLEVPNDRSVRDNEVFTIRRGRLKVSGDVSQHLFLYAQMDFNGSVGGDAAALQMRDLYGDIALDEKQEWRLRFGESKVPYGFINLQSSQNRAALERADAFNSAVENERDFGAYLMWAPEAARKRFKDLVKSGLKGSGDYGVVAVGLYGGQGPNRSDENSQPHVVGRVSYPFAFANGQIMEIGAQYYWGRFVAETDEVDLGGGLITPDQPSNGANDQRGGLSFVWFPQPIGLDVEWNVGEGPELSPDGDRIEARFLHGGYAQLSYRQQTSIGEFLPFTRWNYYAGGRKFATNAPNSTVNEIDAGFEYSPWKEVEIVLSYTHSFERTNTRSAPYDETKNADRIGAQVQWNY